MSVFADVTRWLRAPRRRHSSFYYLIGAGIALFFVSSIFGLRHREKLNTVNLFKAVGWKHPIYTLAIEARAQHARVLAERSLSLADAAARYRQRRGRHPPPGFDAWYAYAERNNAVLVESCFDRIHKDIAPFWGVPPKTVAEQAAGIGEKFRVRNGEIVKQEHYWCAGEWVNLVKEAVQHIPDVDIPIHCLDESRLLVPFERINELVKKEQETRNLVPKHEVVQKFTGLKSLDEQKVPEFKVEWIGKGSYWNLVKATCPPTSPARNLEPAPEILLTEPPPVLEDQSKWNAEYTYKGFISNLTMSRDPCSAPHLREMHGTLVVPSTSATSTEFWPLFGGGKLSRANEMLIPDLAYLSGGSMYSGGHEHGAWWEAKKNGIIWRGLPTGGKQTPSNWARFHRTRLVEMLNGTAVAAVEANTAKAQTFHLPSESMYDHPRRKSRTIGQWLQSFANAGFLSSGWGDVYVAPHMKTVNHIEMSDQYKYKFIPDVDGNGFSGRYRALLLSSSLPIKATLFAEWHDDRLVPWLHFVPMDNSFQELYSMLDYLSGIGDGDEIAKSIAEEGQEWANDVLRREDMVLYMWRLLLEFARVCDEKRYVLGYVGDL